jgi:hypothetical protein
MAQDRRSSTSSNRAHAFERGVVVVSIDTERIWGYLDCMNEAQFERRFPGAPEAHDRLLERLSAAGVSATWFVVGGLALGNHTGAPDQRFSGLPPGRTHLPSSGAASAPLWYCREFLEHLRDACPAQDIGVHGGLTHLLWTAPRSTREIAQRELNEGIRALARLGIAPRSFSYPRNLEAYHDLLPEHGLQCYRGCPPSLAWRLGRTIPGAVLRVWEELRRTPPPIVWPQEVQPRLWSIPASMFFYPIGPLHTRLTGLRSRVERFSRGLEAAARQRGIFHFCFHPENLVESPEGFGLLDEILDKFAAARQRGDVEIMNMRDVVRRIEEKIYGLQKSQQHAELFETDRRL